MFKVIVDKESSRKMPMQSLAGVKQHREAPVFKRKYKAVKNVMSCRVQEKGRKAFLFRYTSFLEAVLYLQKKSVSVTQIFHNLIHYFLYY